MCGFTGIIDTELGEKSLNKFSDDSIIILNHRGPDSNGKFIQKENGISFSHNRLSILDLSSEGNQPMKSTCERFLILFNGEIYNHLILREEHGKNFKWQGSSDTETLLFCIVKFGLLPTLQKVRGMYSFILYDLKEKKVYLVRDISGEKPLYFGISDNKFFFSSEIKSLNNRKLFDKELSTIEIRNYFKFGYTFNSIFKKISKLAPGHYLEFDIKKFKLSSPQNYWKKENKQYSKKCLKENSIELENLLKKSVKEQMISDVPLGAFLSGGIDSSLIASLAQSFSNKSIKTFSIGFDDKNFSETRHAEKVARILNTDHYSLELNSKNIHENIIQLVENMDEPFADGSLIPTYMVSKLSKKHVKVVLTGDGADELFGGYTRYRNVLLFKKRIDKIPKFIKIFSKFVLHNLHFKNLINKSKYFKLSSVLYDDSIQNIYDEYLSQNINDQIFTNNLFKKKFENYKSLTKSISDEKYLLEHDFNNYLPNDILKKLDHYSMLCSLEARAPFLDKRIIEFAFNLPIDQKFSKDNNKIILRKILYKYLPKDIFLRPKQGFGIPIRLWLNTSLYKWADSLLTKKRNNLTFINFEFLKSQWIKYQRGDKSVNDSFIWNNLVFLAWVEKNSDIKI